MRGSRSANVLGIVLALWTVLLTGEPLWLHGCPTMPGTTSSVAASERNVETSGEAEVHAAEDHSVHAHHHASENAAAETTLPSAPDATHHGTDDAPHECNCVGVCACAAIACNPRVAVVRVPAPATVVSTTVRYPEHTSVDARPAPLSRLPWPTAPPQFA